MKKVIIIGAGFTGLAAAYELSQKGIQVIVLESQNYPGGLAAGFKNNKWKYSLEHHYHHLFTSDHAILNLAKKVNHIIIFKKSKTATFFKNHIYKLDSPIDLLKFKPLPPFIRIRTGIVLFFLRINFVWKPLERFTAYNFLTKTMGEKSWQILWKPLMFKKFSKYYKQINACWFWARIKKRSVELGYPQGGFLTFAQSIVNKINAKGGVFKYNSKVLRITKNKSKFSVVTKNKIYQCDAVLCTLPVTLLDGLVDQKLNYYKNFKGIGAINLILSLKESFMNDGTYWLNINDFKYPFLAIVEQTNLVENTNFNNDNIIYIGNYLPSGHPYFKLDEKKLLDIFLPFLNSINTNFDKTWVKKSWVFKANFAQPVVFKNYSKFLPDIETGIENLYLANIQQVYPWDRGTNYAVELGQKVANKIIKSI